MATDIDQPQFNAEREDPPEFRKITIVQQVCADGTIWGTQDRRIMRKRPGKEWEQMARFPIAGRDVFNVCRLGQRAARADKCNLYCNSANQTICVRANTVYMLTDERKLLTLGTINGDCVLHGGFTENAQGSILFGEYDRNTERKPMRVWRCNPGSGDLRIAYEFSAGQVRHIHDVTRDPFNEEDYWILTGDYEDECYFWKTNAEFDEVERFGDGSQTWRAVRLFFTESHICWITDSHLHQNYAYRLDRATQTLEQGQKIGASSWFGTTTTDGIHICCTTIENGPAIQVDSSEVLASEDAFHWETVARYKKDGWRPMSIFKAGVIHCPAGTYAADSVLLSGEALDDFDGTTHRLRVTRR